MKATSDQPRRGRPWTPWVGLGAIVGAVIWTVVPWLQRVALGTRPYVATGFDVGSLAGWLLMFGGLVGFWTTFHHRYGRVGQMGVGLLGLGMVVVTGLLVRRVALFVGAGFRAVPSTGEDPAGLVLTWTFLFGFGLVLVGAGLLGVALWRVDSAPSVAAGVLAATPILVLLAIGLRSLSVLPTPVGRLLVGTNAAFVPFAVGWALLGRLVYLTTILGNDG